MTSIFPSVTETRAGGGAEGGPCSRWSLKCSWPTGVHSTNFVRNIVSGCKGKSLRLALRDTSSPCSAGHPLWHLPEFCSSRLSGQTSGSGKKSTCHSLTSVLSLWDPSIPCKMLAQAFGHHQSHKQQTHKHQSHSCLVSSRAHFLSLTPVMRDKPGRNRTDSLESSSGGSGRTEQMVSSTSSAGGLRWVVSALRLDPRWQCKQILGAL